LAGASATFTWNAGSSATSYWLEVGTSVGAHNLYPGTTTSALSASVSGLPTNGSKVYVRLWTLLAGVWQYTDYTYTAAGSGGGTKAAMQTPTPGSKLASSTVTFSWNAGSGATSYWLEVGTSVGAHNLNTGSNTTALSATVSGLPTNGSTIYVRLWTLLSGAWQYTDYTYTAAGP
jgi:serine protease